MMTAREILNTLGREEVAGRLGVSLHAISKAIGDDRFPAAWWVILREMGEVAGVEIPEAKFNWRGID